MKNKKFLIVVSAITIHLLSGGIKNLLAQDIESSNVQAMAIYKIGPGTAELLPPDEINYNVTSQSVIDNLILSINSSAPRDGSDLLSIPNAYVYIKFLDNSITVYELFDVWMNICKRGHPGRCYPLTQTGSQLFETYAQ